jgi:hypothetical protein
MAVDEIRERWRPYRDGVSAFYSVARPCLREGRTLDGDSFGRLSDVLEGTLENAAALRETADRVLDTERRRLADRAEVRGDYNVEPEEAGGEYDAAVELVLAAATVDAMLACDIAAVDPEFGEHWADVLGASLYEVDVEREDTLRAADDAFSPGGELVVSGAEPYANRGRLIDNVLSSTDSLVRVAEEPGRDLVLGLASLATAGIPAFIHSAGGAQLMDLLKTTAGEAASHAPRFLREHARKLTILRPSPDLIRSVSNQLAAKLDFRVLAVVAQPDRAKTRSRTVIKGSPHITREAAEGLINDLQKLERGYKKQTKWIARSARWLRRAAPPLSHLVAPAVGPAAAAAVFLLGAGYVAYSLTDRLDARNLGKFDLVEGVVPLVSRYL